MPATFTTSQSYGLPSIIVFNDTSTGLVNVAARRIYIQTGYGTYLTPAGSTTDYILWPLATNPISIDILDKDYATVVVIQWVDINGTVLYTATSPIGFTLYNEQELYDLTQDQTSNYSIIQDTNYYSNKMQMRVEIDSGDQAMLLATDIAGAQSCYDRATYLRLNKSLYF